MKRFWTLLILLCSTAVFLVACSDNQAAEAVVPTEPATEAPTLPAVAQPTSTPIVEEVSVDTTDLTLIGQTGNPQFLNAYASW